MQEHPLPRCEKKSIATFLMKQTKSKELLWKIQSKHQEKFERLASNEKHEQCLHNSTFKKLAEEVLGIKLEGESHEEVHTSKRWTR